MTATNRVARLACHFQNHKLATASVPPSNRTQHPTVQSGGAARAATVPGGASTQTYILRHWDQVVPYVGHESALIWPVFRGVDGKADGGWANNVMNGMTGWTIHRLQGRRDGDYHAHSDAEQLYYFLTPAKMLVDGATISVVAGDLLHVPPRVKHQLLNAHSEDWVEHLLVTAPVSTSMLEELVATPEIFKEQLLRNYRDASPTVVAHPGTRNGGSHNDHAHHCAIEWDLFLGHKSHTGTPPGPTPVGGHAGGVQPMSADISHDPINPPPSTLLGLTGVKLQRLQPHQDSENTPAWPDREQLFFITEGEGQVKVNGVAVQVQQGDSLYVPKGHTVRLVNQSDGWLECLTLSAPDTRA